MVAKLKRKSAAQDVVADKARAVCLGQRFLATLVDFPDLAVDVVVAARASHCISGDHHALEHRVRVVTHEVAVFEGAGLALVGIADQIFLALILLRHEAPLEAGRKPSTATTAQRGLLHFRNDLVGRNFFIQYLFECLVAAALDVVGQAPIAPRQSGHQDGVGTVVKEFGRCVHFLISL